MKYALVEEYADKNYQQKIIIVTKQVKSPQSLYRTNLVLHFISTRVISMVEKILFSRLP